MPSRKNDQAPFYRTWGKGHRPTCPSTYECVRLFDVPTRGNYVYFIIFTDDMSRYGYMFLMKYKSEAFEKFKEFRHEVEKQTEKPIKVLRSDRGGEYLSQKFLDYLKDNGIVSQWTPSGTSQLNGVSD